MVSKTLLSNSLDSLMIFWNKKQSQRWTIRYLILFKGGGGLIVGRTLNVSPKKQQSNKTSLTIVITARKSLRI